jgi:hypothetical protein
MVVGRAVSLRHRLMLCGVLALLGLAQISIAFSHSLIPYAIHGKITRVTTMSDTGGESRAIEVRGRTLEVDNFAVSGLKKGRVISKPAWSRTLVVDDTTAISLRPGSQTFRFASLALLSIAATWLLTAPRPPPHR